MLIILGIVLALLISFNSGFLTANETEGTTSIIGNPFAQELPTKDPKVILQAAEGAIGLVLDKLLYQ